MGKNKLDRKISPAPFILTGVFFLLVFIIAGGIKLLPIFFIYFGFNALFYIDNLIIISSFNPIAMWVVVGLLIGSIFGVIIAVKKYKLNPVLIFYPTFISTFIFVGMGIINKPIQNKKININEIGNLTKIFKITNSIVSVRWYPDESYSTMYSIKEGTKVEILDENINQNWTKIIYNNTHGYIQSQFLDFVEQEQNNQYVSNVEKNKKVITIDSSKLIKKIICNNCNGHGFTKKNNSCSHCKGSGSINCSYCAGQGTITCETCYGKGIQTFQSGEDRVCIRCNGNKIITCYRCNGEKKFKCSTCNGSGNITKNISCHVCSGKGLIEQ